MPFTLRFSLLFIFFFLCTKCGSPSLLACPSHLGLCIFCYVPYALDYSTWLFFLCSTACRDLPLLLSMMEFLMPRPFGRFSASVLHLLLWNCLRVCIYNMWQNVMSVICVLSLNFVPSNISWLTLSRHFVSDCIFI